MRFVSVHGRRYAQFERLGGDAGLVHAFSTRPHSVFSGEGPSATRSRRTMVEDWGLDADRLCHCQQTHDGHLAIVESAIPGRPLPRCDAVATAVPAALMTFSADCPLILVYDPVLRAVGLVHASWRCTIAATTRRLIELMQAQLGCRPADMLAGIGPGAGPCCYEVRDDVYGAAADLRGRDRFFIRREGSMYFDLWQANAAQLVEAGVPSEHIEIAGVCTMCRNDVFYSFRREGDAGGHFALLAALLC